MIRSVDRFRCAIVALLVTASPTVHAQMAGAPNATSPAAELFQQGREAMKRNDYAAACDKFEQSERLTSAPGTLLNLAACSEQLGRLATALDSLRSARDLLPATDARVGYVNEQIAALEQRVPRVTIQLVGRRRNAIVSIDGEEVPLEKLAAPIELNLGRHVVTLSVPGRETAKYTLTLEEGRSEILAVRPGNAQGAQASTNPGPPRSADPSGPRATSDGAQTSATPVSRGSSRRTAAYVALGTGGLGLVLGTVTGILVLNRKSTMNSHCDRTFACDSTGLDAASSGKTFSTISTVSFVVAAAGAGLGAYLLLSGDGNGGGSALGVIPSQQGAGVAFRNRF